MYGRDQKSECLEEIGCDCIDQQQIQKFDIAQHCWSISVLNYLLRYCSIPIQYVNCVGLPVRYTLGWMDRWYKKPAYGAGFWF